MDDSPAGRQTAEIELRGAAAQAGRGLPAIDNGMPLPAGTGLSRRTFLSRTAGLALAVYGATRLPLAAFDAGIAHAATPPKVLVSNAATARSSFSMQCR